MKNCLLGLSLLLSIQMVHAGENQERQFNEEMMIENVEERSANLLSAAPRAFTESRDFLGDIHHSLNSSSGFILRPNGEVEARSFRLTVLNAHSKKGLYLIRIESTNPSSFIHDFVIGRVGDEYFGQGVENRIFGILIKRVKRRLEITYSLQSSTGTQNSQVRAIFPLSH